MKPFTILIILLHFAINASMLSPLKEYAQFSDNMQYVVEKTPHKSTPLKSIFTIYSMSDGSKADSLWQCTLQNVFSDLILCNNGEQIILIPLYNGGAITSFKHNGISWEYSLPSKKIHNNTPQDNFIKQASIKTGIDETEKNFSFVLSNKQAYTLDLATGECIDSSFDSLAISYDETSQLAHKINQILFEKIRKNSQFYKTLSTHLEIEEENIHWNLHSPYDLHLNMINKTIEKPSISLELFTEIDSISGEISATNSAETIIEMCNDLSHIIIPKKFYKYSIDEINVFNSFTAKRDAFELKPILDTIGYKTDSINAWYKVRVGDTSYNTIDLVYDPQSKILTYRELTDSTIIPHFFEVNGRVIRSKTTISKFPKNNFEIEEEMAFPSKGFLHCRVPMSMIELSKTELQKQLGKADSVTFSYDGRIELHTYNKSYLARVFFYKGKLDLIQVKK